MKLKSTTYYWLAVIFGGIGVGTAMGAEGTAQTTGYISGTLFAASLVLILAAVLLARMGFAAEDRERAAKRRKYGKINRRHAQTRKPKKPYKYIMRRELVERREAELPPPRTRGKGRKRHEDCH